MVYLRYNWVLGIPQMADIEEIKSKLDIVDVIASYVPDLKKAGANYKACCPFHSEKTPSFTVNPSLQIFKCFGCGKAGDVIKFIEEVEHTDFTDALKIAAEKAGVELTQNISPRDQKERKEKEQLLNANLLTAKFYNYIIMQHKSGKKGLDYAMQKREIDIERIKDFMVGFAPNLPTNLKSFLVAKGFVVSDLVRWGLLVERNGQVIDKFRDRVMQPIFNLKGEVVAFSGRYIGTVKEAPKYLNSPETPVYKKNEMLYGLYQAKDFLKENNFLILVEGNIDILSSHRVGIGNIVAPLGTAFTVNQAKLIKRFAETVYFSFDTDEAGLKALIRGMGIAEEIELKHKVIDLTGYQDADELIRKDPENWPERIKNAKQTMDYLIEYFTKELDMGSAEGKSTFEYKILPCLSLLKDEVLFNHYRKLIASLLEVSEDFVNSRIEKTKSHSPIREEKQEVEVIPEVVTDVNPEEKYMLELLIAFDKFQDLKFTEENFLSDVKILFQLIREHSEEGFDVIKEKVPLNLQNIYDEIVMNGLDLSDKIPNLVEILNKKAGDLRKKYHSKRRITLSRELKLSEGNPEQQQKLQEESNQILKERLMIDKGLYKII